jgi:hypothetical protein
MINATLAHQLPQACAITTESQLQLQSFDNCAIASGGILSIVDLHQRLFELTFLLPLQKREGMLT